MNIESKRFKIKSIGYGGYTVLNKKTQESKYVALNVPSVNHLAAISESEFDKEMEKLME